jgi:hypothetical protein
LDVASATSKNAAARGKALHTEGTIVIRPANIDADDDRWRASVDRWLEQARRLTGNTVELLEATDEEVRRLLRGRKPLWLDVQRDGVVVYGLEMDDLRGRRSA